jgi:peroxiredoxin
MPKTESNPIELGTKAADFLLPDAQGVLHRLPDFDAKPALLVAFISNRCPFVVLIREQLAAFARDYAGKGLQVVAINANDHEAHPEETLARIGEEAEKFSYSFPYLKDASQQTAKAYGAACTPDFFLFDADRRLAYHGQFDDARPGNGKQVTGADLRAAVDTVLEGGRPAVAQVPSIGCNIKWSTGNEPVWSSSAARAA